MLSTPFNDFYKPFNEIVSDESFKNDEFYYIASKQEDIPQKPTEIKNNEYTTKATLNKEQISNLNEIEEKNKELKNYLYMINYDLLNYKDPLETEIPKKNISSLSKKRERLDANWEDYKYRDDNIRRKIKNLILNNLMNFINNKIAEKYQDNMGYGIYIKKLLIINQKLKSDSTIEFNKDFLNKSIGDIFSQNISTRYTNYPLTHNKSLIYFLINYSDDEKRNYFNKLFSLTFFDVLKHLRGSQEVEELKGLNSMNSLLKEFDEVIGLDRLLVVHVNDSKNIRGAHKDRHENLGYGEIGFEALCRIANHPLLKSVPKILETPYINEKPPYSDEIRMLRAESFEPDWKDRY
jgi:hypothetical protein